MHKKILWLWQDNQTAELICAVVFLFSFLKTLVHLFSTVWYPVMVIEELSSGKGHPMASWVLNDLPSTRDLLPILQVLRHKTFRFPLCSSCWPGQGAKAELGRYRLGLRSHNDFLQSETCRCRNVWRCVKMCEDVWRCSRIQAISEDYEVEEVPACDGYYKLCASRQGTFILHLGY